MVASSSVNKQTHSFTNILDTRIYISVRFSVIGYLSRMKRRRILSCNNRIRPKDGDHNLLCLIRCRYTRRRPAKFEGHRDRSFLERPDRRVFVHGQNNTAMIIINDNSTKVD